jgi:hypothetical protein
MSGDDPRPQSSPPNYTRRFDVENVRETGTAAVHISVNEASSTVRVSTATPNSGSVRFTVDEWREFTGDIIRAAAEFQIEQYQAEMSDESITLTGRTLLQVRIDTLRKFAGLED